MSEPLSYDVRLVLAAIEDLEGNAPGSLPDTREALIRLAAAEAELETLREAASAFVAAHDMQARWGDDYEWPADEYTALAVALSSDGGET